MTPSSEIKDPLEAKFDALAQCITDFKNAIRGVIDDLPDAEALRLADLAHRHSLPGESPFDGGFKNFTIPIWKEVSKIIRYESKLNDWAKAAKAYMAKPGAIYYCVHCRGECLPEHYGEMENE